MRLRNIGSNTTLLRQNVSYICYENRMGAFQKIFFFEILGWKNFNLPHVFASKRENIAFLIFKKSPYFVRSLKNEKLPYDLPFGS